MGQTISFDALRIVQANLNYALTPAVRNPHPNPLPSPAKGEGISSPRFRGEDQGEGALIEPVTATFNHTPCRSRA